MISYVSLYSSKSGELNNFLSKFYNNNLDICDINSWEKKYNNPIEIAEIIGTFIDNIDNFDITMWVSLDKGLLIEITEENANDIIKYLYERFPY